MANKYVDVWKYPHMSYKKAFAIATVISIAAVGISFMSFSDYIASHMTGPMQVNFLTEQEADKVEEEVKQQIQEEQKQQEVTNHKPNTVAGGAGKGGQGGTSATPTRSNITPSSQKATAGEVGSIKSSSVGSSTGDGLVGAPGPGIGNAEGSGEGLSDEAGNGGTESGEGGGGTFDAGGYQADLQSIVYGNYPSQARAMGIQGSVELLITFGPDGSVVGVDVISSDDDILTEHAVANAWSASGAVNTTGETQQSTVRIVYDI